MYEKIAAELESYAREKRFSYSHVIHGDPVFSNVLLNDDGHVFLLDMRGELGSTLTLQGDALYDLSKVYQSLLGYDYILLSQPLLERDGELLEELRHAFRRFVSEHYPAVRMADITRLTAQHYFGIVPLHQNQQHQLAYLQTCAALLSSVGLEARHSDPTSPGAAGGPSSSFGGPPAPAPAPSPLSAGGSVAVEEPSAERSRRHSAPSVAPQLDNV